MLTRVDAKPVVFPSDDPLRGANNPKAKTPNKWTFKLQEKYTAKRKMHRFKAFARVSGIHPQSSA